MESSLQPDQLLMQLRPDLPAEERLRFRNALADALNRLILDDFPALIQLLYRVDVDEQRLKTLLRDHAAEDAGVLIADLLIERQFIKLAQRDRFHSGNAPSEEERW